MVNSSKQRTITHVKDCIKFMTYYLYEMCVSTGYPIEAIQFESMLDEWAQHKDEDIRTYRGDGTNSFPIDLNTNILENTTPFLRIAATLVYRSFELVNSKFK